MAGLELEMTYVDAIDGLKNSVEGDDSMPKADQSRALALLEELGKLLWPYSA